MTGRRFERLVRELDGLDAAERVAWAESRLAREPRCGVARYCWAVAVSTATARRWRCGT